MSPAVFTASFLFSFPHLALADTSQLCDCVNQALKVELLLIKMREIKKQKEICNLSAILEFL